MFRLGNETDLRAFVHFQIGERIKYKLFSTWAPAIAGLFFGIGYFIIPFIRRTGHADAWYPFYLVVALFVIGLIYSIFPLETKPIESKFIGGLMQFPTLFAFYAMLDDPMEGGPIWIIFGWVLIPLGLYMIWKPIVNEIDDASVRNKYTIISLLPVLYPISFILYASFGPNNYYIFGRDSTELIPFFFLGFLCIIIGYLMGRKLTNL